MVFRGPGTFVEVAPGFEDLGHAMERKLLREVSGFQLRRGRAGGPPAPGGG